MTQENGAMPEQEFGEDTGKKLKWANFIESQVADFFVGYKLEKMSIEDGSGNKAKLSRTKDNNIKVEYTSTTTL